jgi:subtilisin family serine protease
MAKEIRESPIGELSDEVLQKLDGGLRRLLRMTDEEVLKAVDTHETRLKEGAEKAEWLARMLPKTASDADREAVLRVQDMYRARLLPHRALGLVIVADKVKPVIKARAIVRFTGNQDDLAALGLEVRAQAHDIFTVVGTTQQLVNLAAQPAARSVRLPRIFLPTVEQAGAQGEVHAVHQPRPANPVGFRGNGMIVGIIDSALDVTHHGFRDPDLTGTHGSRVLYYWVQDPFILDAWGNPVFQANPPGQTPQQFHNADPTNTPNFGGFNYGRLYTTADVDAALTAAGGPYGTGANQICCEPTTSQHGTHVAGIAAGSGHESNWNTAPTHIGAAPEATIIHVCRRFTHQNVQNGTWEDDVVNAIDFIFRAAAFHNMPAVINVSLGTNLGPHNGASEFDQFRDNLLNSFEERSVVWSAGNDNDEDGFRRGTIAAGATEVFTVTPGWAIGNTLWLDVWYTGPELDFQVECGGNSSGWRTAGNEYHGNLHGYAVDVDREVESGGGMRSIRMYVINAQTADPWTIRLRNPHASNAVQYYTWVGLQGWWGDVTGATQDELTLSDTGAGKSILTVGSCDKRLPPNPAAGETIADYSGAGPTVDGRIKPEIVAVGGTLARQIMSTRSDQNSGYVGKHGTSMAAPLVAGAVALLFEEGRAQNRPMTQDTVKGLLTQSTNRLNLNLDPTQPGFVQTELNQYGYGRLRLITPIDHIRPAVDVDVWVRTAADDYGEEPYPGGCFCGAPDIRVFEAGTNNETTQLIWGTTYDVKVTVRNLGNDLAVGTTVRLKYTYPWTAPNAWVQAQDASNNALERTIDVPALSQRVETFQWRPEASEISGAPAGQTHFCLLAEVDHALDLLTFSAPTTAGGSAWATNIKGVNNVALRNLHIQ